MYIKIAKNEHATQIIISYILSNNVVIRHLKYLMLSQNKEQYLNSRSIFQFQVQFDQFFTQITKIQTVYCNNNKSVHHHFVFSLIGIFCHLNRRNLFVVSSLIIPRIQLSTNKSASKQVLDQQNNKTAINYWKKL